MIAVMVPKAFQRSRAHPRTHVPSFEPLRPEPRWHDYLACAMPPQRAAKVAEVLGVRLPRGRCEALEPPS